MSQERQDFVDVLPLNSLKTGLAAVKGEQVSKRDLALAFDNIFSYTAGQFFPENDIPIFAAVASVPMPTKDAAIAAFAEVMPDGEGTMRAGNLKGSFFQILKALLPLVIGLL